MDDHALRGRRIAITGASGFVGGRLARSLLARGVEVIGFGRRPAREARLEPGAYRRWDITEGPLVDPPKVDAVVHCAGTVTDWGPRALFERCHVDGTGNVLASFPAEVPIVHISTASVYDPFAPKVRVREDAPLPARYLNDYAETKAAAERLVLAREASVVLRPHAIYGPGDTVLVPRILAAYRFGRLLAVGDGKNRISLTHVDNLVLAAERALVCALGGEGGRRVRGVFNVADAEPTVLDEALRAVLGARGLPARITYVPRRLGYGLGAVLERVFEAAGSARAPRLTRYIVAQLASEYTLDLGKATAELGYRPSHTFRAFAGSGEL
jgi:nucleoside-diphosphate-sugar epimerase